MVPCYNIHTLGSWLYHGVQSSMKVYRTCLGKVFRHAGTPVNQGVWFSFTEIERLIEELGFKFLPKPSVFIFKFKSSILLDERTE